MFTSFINIYKSLISCSRSARVVSARTILKWQYQPFVINLHIYRPYLLVKTQVQYQLFNCNTLISKPKQNLIHQYYCVLITCHLPHNPFIKRHCILPYFQHPWSFIVMSWIVLPCTFLVSPLTRLVLFTWFLKLSINSCSEQILLGSLGKCDLSCAPLQSHKRVHLNRDGSK